MLAIIGAAVVGEAAAQSFVHPGGLHTQTDLDRMKAKVAAGEHPWIDGWNRLIEDPKAQNTYRATPQANMGVSRQRAQDDATAAYLNALRWYISGDKSFAECAVRNLNGWSATVRQVPSGVDQPGLGGIPIGSFALAAEVLRTYSGWSAGDQNRFKRMLRNYFYPVCNSFLTRHNGADASHYWANWDAANILAVMAIGVFCDDRAKFDQAVEYFKNGEGMGSIMHAVQFLYPDGLGQWQESGRDQAHAFGGTGLLAETCQVAWNQNVDLFGYSQNRLLAGAEYTAQYTQWKGVPYTFYNNCDNARQYYISANYHGRLGNCQFFELLYNHYVLRKGLRAPNVKRFAELLRPEGGNADIFGYGTLTFTLDAAASPHPASPVPPIPQDLSATAGIGRVDLKWSPSGAYSTQGYDVSRADSKDGPFTSIYSTANWTTPQYTDTKVENGAKYYYVVSAINQSGVSARSAAVQATPVAGAGLPADWKFLSVGGQGTATGAEYAETANNSFVVPVAGGGIGGATDGCNFVARTVTGDFTITARLTDRQGPANKIGVMMRESAAANAKTLAMTLGEVGGRQARFGVRAATAGKMAVQSGDDYTWIPVWLRLQRTGDVFTAFQSSDGITWFAVGTATVAMPKIYLVGLAAASGGKGSREPATATFDHVAIEITPPPPPAAPTGLAASAPDGSSIQLTWKNAATTETGVKIEASSDKAPFYEIADLAANATRFVNTGLSAPASLHYRVRAYNTGGYSAYSNIAGLAESSPPQR